MKVIVGLIKWKEKEKGEQIKEKVHAIINEIPDCREEYVEGNRKIYFFHEGEIVLDSYYPEECPQNFMLILVTSGMDENIKFQKAIQSINEIEGGNEID